MDKIRFDSLGLETALSKAVRSVSEDYDISLNETDSGLAFEELIKKLHKKYDKTVVVLIDEYDKPIIHYLEKDKSEQMLTNRDIMKLFYGILKDNGQHLRFTSITGVSKFSKVSIFSDLNYLLDLTLDTRLDYISIMLQTGYLTFKEDLGEGYYKANYPNKEVEKGFSKMLLEGYTNRLPSQISKTVYDIEQCLDKHDLEGMIKIVGNMFETLPPQFFVQAFDTLDKQGNIKTVTKAVNESFYHAIIYLIFNILGVRMNAEVSAGDGRIDAVVETKTHIYIFEFKKNRTGQAALKQIIDNKYPNRFALSKKQIYLIGLSFSLQKRGINSHAIVAYP